MKKRLVCLGDSNTFGYDPRGYLGGRYPADVRWTGRLSASGFWDVINAGENGREIPRREVELRQVDALLSKCVGLDVLVVLLGTNDLLMDPACAPAARMEAFLRRTLAHPAMQNVPALLIAPPPLRAGAWVTDAALPARSAQLAPAYQATARTVGAAFADAGAWDIPVCFDGVHFTQTGHRRFAQRLEPILCRLTAP